MTFIRIFSLLLDMLSEYMGNTYLLMDEEREDMQERVTTYRLYSLYRTTDVREGDTYEIGYEPDDAPSEYRTLYTGIFDWAIEEFEEAADCVCVDDNDYYEYVECLEPELKDKIRERLENIYIGNGPLSQDDIERAMASRVCDLDDTIGIAVYDARG